VICPLRPFDFYPDFTNGTVCQAFTDLYGPDPILAGLILGIDDAH